MKTTSSPLFKAADTYLHRHIETPPLQPKTFQLMRTLDHNRIARKIKICTWIIITGLFLSGATAFPIETELQWLTGSSGALPGYMQSWLITVYQAIKHINRLYPFLSYGTDWLAFAHIMLAILFIGPLRDPVKNIWVIEFGMIACVMIIPLAFIMGPVRGIPFFWRLVDSSFGVIGIIPLYISYINTKKLQQLNKGGL